ncbi:hypothetical protein V1511DRAFT_451814, partial [Dipodascopsis uninucleata]
CVCTGMPGDCHTAAPQRKVVSHIFGRNKRQTLAVPENMWVYMCRKHYQRESYRKETFPILQARLVLMQIDKLEEWGHVVNFAVKMRPGKHSPSLASHSSPSPPLSPSGSDTSSTVSSHSLLSPDVAWQSHTKRKYTFQEVRQLVHNIIESLVAETDISLRVFPCMEILPNVDVVASHERRGRKR